MAVYMIADTHFGHKNIIKYRNQFNSIEEHDDFILDSILKTVGKRDSLYILGDAFIGKNSLEQLREITSKVGFLHVILGNHCDERKGSPTVKTLVEYCKSVHAFKEYKNAWLSHAPIHPKELRGKFNVYGHVHSNVINEPGYFCVSCEALDYKPVNFVEIASIMG